jgi:hypothetical protein
VLPVEIFLRNTVGQLETYKQFLVILFFALHKVKTTTPYLMPFIFYPLDLSCATDTLLCRALVTAAISIGGSINPVPIRSKS